MVENKISTIGWKAIRTEDRIQIPLLEKYHKDYSDIAISDASGFISITFKKRDGDHSWLSSIEIEKPMFKAKVISEIKEKPSFRGECEARCENCNRRNEKKVCDYGCGFVTDYFWCREFLVTQKFYIEEEKIKLIYLSHAKKLNGSVK